MTLTTLGHVIRDSLTTARQRDRKGTTENTNDSATCNHPFVCQDWLERSVLAFNTALESYWPLLSEEPGILAARCR